MGAGGLALGKVPFFTSQSWGYAVVNGRLQAISTIGSAAGDALAGRSPADAFSTEGYAASFLKNSRQGNTPNADLDAALLGLNIGIDNLNFWTGNSLFWCLLNKDAAGIAANLPNYTAENAWDMLSEAEVGLDGL
jgi:hypothetical protein